MGARSSFHGGFPLAQAIPRAVLAAMLLALLVGTLFAEDGDEKKKAEPTKQENGEKNQAPKKNIEPALRLDWAQGVVEKARPSLASITFLGRDGRTEGMGTGFVIDAEGLIATNHHVIGEARPIRVRLADGREFDVVSVHASDRDADLAVLKIEAKGLPTLTLGDSSKVEPGQPVAVLGNPRGLEQSVTAGVVSARREIEGQSFLQLAVPIEQGNSGGPVLNPAGEVLGIVNMKSLVTPNLGFAVEINRLKPLLEKPNTVAMNRWLTIGSLDPRDWTATAGSRWRQHAGRIQVDGWGGGFGGRSLCLSNHKPAKDVFEVGVFVKLDDESGAGGLVFHADGNDRHYGFYPSGGRLRLSRFDGPDVLQWQVLADVRSKAYRPGDWNWLKVRIEKGKIACFVNDEPTIESTDAEYAAGMVGMAKFRSTSAEFKQFEVGEKLPLLAAPEEVQARIEQRSAEYAANGETPSAALVEALREEGKTGVSALRRKAQALEDQAQRLRRLAEEVHRAAAVQALKVELEQAEEKIDLFHAGLLLAWHDNDELDVPAYRRDLERLAAELKAELPEKADEAEVLKRLNEFLFKQHGFHGSRGDYYNRSNSYLNEVLDDREGLPITLSVVYIELARRVGLTCEGVGLPGHFVVRFAPKQGEPTLVDVFDGGKTLSRRDAEKMVLENAGAVLNDEHLKPADKGAIVVRMVHNLMGERQRKRDAEGMLPYLDLLLTLRPEAAENRWMRAVVCFQLDRRDQARSDVEWILEQEPETVDLDEARRLQRLLEQEAR